MKKKKISQYQSSSKIKWKYHRKRQNRALPHTTTIALLSGTGTLEKKMADLWDNNLMYLLMNV